MAEANLQVAVRLRPFNAREKSRNAKRIIGMIENTTTIVDPEGQFPEKKFTFDYSYWSHDGFTERDDGYLIPADDRYADQDKVFEDLGKGVLENAWKGFNCSLFAYGQTGSGKSYSMVGYNVNKGIIPITCEELFSGIEKKKETGEDGKEAEYQVSLSMLEIYNETVKDLLNVASFKKGGLKIREHPQKGFYVEQLQVSPVCDYGAIEGKIAEGTRNRTLAATNMNATSSRAHTIVAINFTQKAMNDAGKSMTKTSIINLVDLAGSERAESTGATGDRLKEGSMINRSLLCLGNCIKALADAQEGKNVTVPFRDSTLTRLLKNALGGNSKTIMIAALSPADINYDETLSTLRFADRAKNIKTKAVVNESPTDKLIREMKEEITKLQDLLKTQGPGGGGVAIQGVSSVEFEEQRRIQEEELRRNQEEIENMKRTWEQRLAQQDQGQQQQQDVEKTKQEARKTTPNFWNLNEDPMLTGMIVHLTPPGVITIGNTAPASIILRGLSIMKEHAVIENDSNSSVFLTPCPGSKLLVNGKSITEKTELHHNNRVMFGSNHLYAFNHPQEVAKMEEDGKCPMKISFESAQEEIAQSKGFDMDKSGKTKDDIILQDTMVQMMTMVNEANAISEELDQKMFYEIVLMSAQAQGLSEGKTEVSIKAKTLTNGNEVIWTKGDFVDRKYAMQEIYQAYMEEDKDWNKKQENGFPFSSTDDNEIMIGTASLYVQSLAYLMDMDDNLPVRSYNGTEVGVLSIEALPFSEQGQQLLDECVEEPEELIGKNFQFRIDIKKILGLPKKLNKVWCRYTFLLEEEWNESEHVAATQNADMTFQKMFKAFPVTKELVDEFENTAVVIQVWGNQTAAPDDPAKANLSTKELMTFEDAVSIFKSEKHGMHNKAAQQSRELRRKESELNHLQVTLNDMKKSQLATEQQSTMLKQENHELERKVVSQKAKLDLMTKIVKEAQTKGEQVALVARIDFILRNAKDLPQQDIDKLLNRIKDPTSSNIKSSTPPEAKPSSKKAPKRPSTPSSRN